MKTAKLILTSCVSLLLGSCALFEKVAPGSPDAPVHSVRSVALQTTATANQSAAVSVDIVFIFDAVLAQSLPQLSARAWFSAKTRYLAQYPDGLTARTFELVPSSEIHLDVDAQSKPLTGSRAPKLTKARTVIVYANYLDEEIAYTRDISALERPVICLKERQMLVLRAQDRCVE